jgi:16S rRNA (cytosine967-C5)-methyltransferase
VAVRILGSVLDRRQPLERAVELERSRLDALEPRDRGFALTIVRAVLRRLRFLDAVLARLLERPLPADAARVRLILLAGAAQVLLLDTPAHAAVNVAVEQCRHDRITGRFAKLVNAVMRRVPGAATSVSATWDSPRADIPDWLFQRWSKAYGDPEARQVAAASLERAALDITVREHAETWAERLGAKVLSTGSLRLVDAGVVPDLPGYAEEAWWVQDAAAALPARLLGSVAGQSIADLCAAPGGKTAQLASRGAHVTAVDGSKARMGRLGENMQRLGLGGQVDLVVADIETYQPGTQFDAVLLDAPCSATGTIRRHPDILHLKSASDIARLALLQARLLATAASLVKPGGLLVYCTCSLEPEEGEDQIERFLAGAPGFERVAIVPSEIGGDASWLTSAGDLRTLPFHAAGPFPEARGLDGFFAARLRRVA